MSPITEVLTGTSAIFSIRARRPGATAPERRPRAALRDVASTLEAVFELFEAGSDDSCFFMFDAGFHDGSGGVQEFIDHLEFFYSGFVGVCRFDDERFEEAQG